MESALIKKYIQNIDDFVFIEEKIVTYLWLCQVLKIHVNTAKQLLHVFSSKEDVKNKLLVTYVLGGDLKNKKGKLLKLVIADSREATKQLFSKITIDHVFSIQMAGGSYSSTDLFNSYPHFSVNPEGRRFCPIHPNKAIEKREVKHIIEVKNFLNTKQTVKQSLNKDNEELRRDVKKDSRNKNPIEDSCTTEREPTTKQQISSANDKEVKSVKAGSIGSFFNRQAEKQNSESSDNKEKSKKTEEKTKTGIGAFFKSGNMNGTSKKEVKEKENNNKLETIQVENKPKPKENGKLKLPLSASDKDKKSKRKENKRKRKKKDEDEGAEKKKRKRIVSALSSDSDSSGNESSECEMEVEPEQPPPVITADDEDIIPPTPGRKRVRKQIDKVFTDDDGFIITKKEFVYESCSDDDAKEEKPNHKEDNSNEIKKTVQKTPESKIEISPNNIKKKFKNDDKINKQSSITNFFKRKAS